MIAHNGLLTWRVQNTRVVPSSGGADRAGKGGRYLLPERPGGCCAQKVPDPFSVRVGPSRRPPKGGTTNRRRRAAFTLTELMVVIMVISILASTVLFAMFEAVETARQARTKTQITKLHDLLMTRWESYRTRAIRVSLSAQARRDLRTVTTVRLSAMRDLMRMEMPDRIKDVTDDPVSIQTAFGPVNLTKPSLLLEYRRRATKNGTRPITDWSVTYQDAECLYMIIASMRDISSNGLDFLREGEISDLDGDEMPEILDAWGQPIAFLRWPAGFVAHPGPDYNYLTADDIPSYSAILPFAVDANDQYVEPEDRDPFDPLRADKRQGVIMPNAASAGGNAKYYFNYRLYPLVCSGGPDEVWDIVRFDYQPATPSTVVPFDYYRGVNLSSPPPTYQGWRNDPYSILPTCGRRLGEPFLDSYGYVDNITNHALGE